MGKKREGRRGMGKRDREEGGEKREGRRGRGRGREEEGWGRGRGREGGEGRGEEGGKEEVEMRRWMGRTCKGRGKMPVAY